MINFAEIAHIPQIVKIHKEALPNDFLPKLGKESMAAFYMAFLEENVIIIASSKNEVIGFLALSTRPVNYLKLIKNNKFVVLFHLFFKPSLWGQAFWLIFGTKKKTIYPEISFIAVQPLYQRKGFGVQLINYACDYLLQHKFERLEVKTEANNLNSNNFYLKNNFKKINREKRFNRIFNIYTRVISNNAS